MDKQKIEDQRLGKTEKWKQDVSEIISKSVSENGFRATLKAIDDAFNEGAAMHVNFNSDAQERGMGNIDELLKKCNAKSNNTQIRHCAGPCCCTGWCKHTKEEWEGLQKDKATALKANTA